MTNNGTESTGGCDRTGPKGEACESHFGHLGFCTWPKPKPRRKHPHEVYIQAAATLFVGEPAGAVEVLDLAEALQDEARKRYGAPDTEDQ